MRRMTRDRKLEQAQVMVFLGAYREARQLLLESPGRGHRAVEGRILLFRIYLGLQDWSAGNGLFSKVQTSNPEALKEAAAQFKLGYAEALRESGHTEAAGFAMEELRGVYPEVLLHPTEAFGRK